MKLFEATIPAPRHEAALLLDLDGLTLDTEHPQRRIYQELFLEMTGVELGPYAFAWAVGASYQETVSGLNAMLTRYPLKDPSLIPEGASPGEYIVRRLREERKRERQASGLEVMPFVPELLSWADSLSIPRAVSTSREREVAHEMLEAAQLADKIHVVVGKGSEGVVELKPAPDIHLVSAAKLCTKPRDCWALEDSPPGVRGAWNAKANVIYVPDARVAGPSGMARRLATYTARSMEDALQFLQRQL